MSLIDLDAFSLDAHKKKSLLHYYGDNVRTVFLIGSATVLLSLPIFARVIADSIIYPVTAIAVFVIAAGLANPAQRWTMVLNTIVAAGAVAFFEYQALLVSGLPATTDWQQSFLFFENHALALLFLVALYYSIKTTRGRLLKKNVTDQE
ncbi:MAG: hypothetical protein HY455_01580 [Parcubacteria group bacterium]|nr:hypothetical protein [Parcubacteria group bacterium]